SPRCPCAAPRHHRARRRHLHDPCCECPQDHDLYAHIRKAMIITQTQHPTVTRPVGTGQTQDQHLAALGHYEWGWADSDVAGASAQRGLTPEIVANISRHKNEPKWMLDLRLKGHRLFGRKPLPTWGAELDGIDFDNIKYFVRSTEQQAPHWDDL